MPRQIIDVESGRPGYVRRRAIRWAIVVLVLLVLAIAALVIVRYHEAHTVRSLQETHRVSAEPRWLSHPRRFHAA